MARNDLHRCRVSSCEAASVEYFSPTGWSLGKALMAKRITALTFVSLAPDATKLPGVTLQ